MKDNLTEIVCVVDKSGSMQRRTKDVIGGFNQFLEDQKKVPGDAALTLTLFDTAYHIVHNGKPLAEIPSLDAKTYMAGGMTALLDAVGKTMDEVGFRLHNTNEADRPGKVLFLIITDGEENSSREYTLDQIREKIKLQQEAYKWDFVFLGANQDAFAGASNLNIPQANAIPFADSAKGIRSVYRGMTQCVSSYRSSGKVDRTSWDADQK